MRFSMLHPYTLIVYFISVIGFTMITTNPIFIIISLLSAVISFAKTAKRTDLSLYLPLFFIIALTNPIFSHNGATPLFFIGNMRITLEAIIYGFFSSGTIVASIYWIKLFGKVFGIDKLTYIIGNLSPRLCVVFTMALRYIPLFKQNATSIYNAQIAMGIAKIDTLRGKLSLYGDVFSSLISMSMENAIETADTMRSRGFGKGKRSTYSLIHFTKFDLMWILYIIILDFIIILSYVFKSFTYFYYPTIYFEIGRFAALTFVAFVLLFFSMTALEIEEDLKWKYLISKI